MGEPGRNFVDVVSHHHQRRREAVLSQSGQGLDQLLATRQVEPGGRLVQHEQAGVSHQRAREQHSLTLSG